MAEMLVTPELFLELFGLPKDTRIIGAKCEYPYRYIQLIVIHPDIPWDCLSVRPNIMTHYAEGCGHIEKLEMIDWGIRS